MLRQQSLVRKPRRQFCASNPNAQKSGDNVARKRSVFEVSGERLVPPKTAIDVGQTDPDHKNLISQDRSSKAAYFSPAEHASERATDHDERDKRCGEASLENEVGQVVPLLDFDIQFIWEDGARGISKEGAVEAMEIQEQANNEAEAGPACAPEQSPFRTDAAGKNAGVVEGNRNEKHRRVKRVA